MYGTRGVRRAGHNTSKDASLHSTQPIDYTLPFFYLVFVDTIMGFYLGTFATWLRQARALSDDVEILSDRAAIPKDRKRRPTTRWDHLAKQQSFSMPKVPSRRRLGDTIEEDAVTEATATESCPSPTQMKKQASLSYPPRGGKARPGLGAKQSSLRNLPGHPRAFNSHAEVEQMKMPRLVKQKSSRALRRGLTDEEKSTGGRRCMNKQDSFSLPNYSKRVSRRELNYRPKLPIRTQDSDSDETSDETSDNLSSMPRMVKQRSFTVARLLSRAPLIGNDEKGANGTYKQEQMAEPDSFTMPKRPTRKLSNSDEVDEKTETLSRIPRLVKQMSFTVSRHSSQAPLIGDDEKGGHVIVPDPCSSPRRPTRTLSNKDEVDERTKTLSSMPRLVTQTSFTVAKHSSQAPLIGDDEKEGHAIVPNSPFSSPNRPIRTFDSDDEASESSGTLELEDDESDDDSNSQSNSDATPEPSPHNSSPIHESKSTSDLQPSSDATPEYSPHNSAKIHESKSTSDLLPQDISTSDVDVVIETKLRCLELFGVTSKTALETALPGQSKAVDCTTESAECTYHQREPLYTA
jgi:hypothetical protein